MDLLEKVEAALGELLADVRPDVLREAMRHAVMPGGKRLRPQICLASAVAAGGNAEDAIFPACAIELLHCYTLVHDDLPAMDDDAVRRGVPSVWAKYGEANAVLAGDALQALAFKAAARTSRNAVRVLSALGEAGFGVVCGQAAELSSLSPQPETFDFIYRHKTADLFVAAAEMGAHAGGGTAAAIDCLRAYALNLGMAFQHEDDLIDGDSPFGEEEARRRIADLTAAAVASLEGLPGDVSFLSALAKRLVARER